jgi:hypothetical protein
MANLTKGTQIGRALTKLTAINSDEQAELAQSPAAIRQRHEAKRAALLRELEPDVRAAVIAATLAMGDAEEAPESE